jgi:hypothetical protein
MKNRRESSLIIWLVIPVLVCVLCLAVLSSSASAASTPKLFRTCLGRDGGNALVSGDEVTIAKYDLAILNRFHYGNIADNTWQAIKKLNPAIEIYLYQMGAQTAKRP